MTHQSNDDNLIPGEYLAYIDRAEKQECRDIKYIRLYFRTIEPRISHSIKDFLYFNSDRLSVQRQYEFLIAAKFLTYDNQKIDLFPNERDLISRIVRIDTYVQSQKLSNGNLYLELYVKKYGYLKPNAGDKIYDNEPIIK